MRTVKVLPLPGELSTAICPPSLRTTLSQKESPIPVPSPTGLVVKNGSNSRARTLESMPHPESEIDSHDSIAS